MFYCNKENANVDTQKWNVNTANNDDNTANIYLDSMISCLVEMFCSLEIVIFYFYDILI